MAGPGAVLQDLERGEADPSAADPLGNPSGKTRPNADAKEDSTRSSTLREGEGAVAATDGPHNHALLEKLKAHVHPSVQARSSLVWGWLRGPDPQKPWRIRPFLPRLQQFPLRLVDRFLPRQWQRIAVLFLFYVCWVATFAAVLRKSSIVDDVNGYGQPILLSCGSVFW